MSQSAVKRLQSDYLELLREPIEYIIAKPSEEDILLWHYVLFGPPDCPYAGGEYHGTIVFPFEYPFKPPGIQMLTPNGRFNPTMKICLTMSDYHPETWNPSWTVTTLLLGLLSFMVDPTEPTGVGCIRESGERRLQLAKESRQFNLSDPSFCGISLDRSIVSRTLRDTRIVTQTAH
ncbi:ubiquitin-conjugating enzyme/RWD-like protein [Gorgonomyces haynaldii]|nr:ubiquitin-conjugating enzyme/RWD-like protein [Gorgonomyces haynaldii]